MPFGLCNAPATFQRYINSVLHDALDVYCSAYVDDVLIFSKTLEEHHEHVRKVLTKLREAGLPVDLKKSQFDAHEVTYLGLVVNGNGVRKDPKKIQAVLDWPAPKSISDVQAFVGFASFYRRFIPGFSHLASPLNALVKVIPSKKEETPNPSKKKKSAL
jgi:hypothetical protein